MEKQPISDQGIIELLFDRDEKGLSAIVAQYGPKLEAIAFRMLGDRSDAEECLNDVYLSVWQSIPPTKPKALIAYLVRLLRNRAIDRLKNKKRQKEIPSECLIALDDLDRTLSDALPIYETLEEKILSEAISSFVRSLPKKRRTIFIARFYMGETIDAIAEKLMIHRSTVMRELARIKKELGNYLKEVE